MKQSNALNSSPVEIDLSAGPQTSPLSGARVLLALKWSCLAAPLRSRWRPDAPDAGTHDRSTIVCIVRDIGDGSAVLDMHLQDGSATVSMLHRGVTYRVVPSAGMRHVDVWLGERRLLAASIDEATGAIPYAHCAILADLGVHAGGYDPPEAHAVDDTEVDRDI